MFHRVKSDTQPQDARQGGQTEGQSFQGQGGYQDSARPNTPPQGQSAQRSEQEQQKPAPRKEDSQSYGSSESQSREETASPAGTASSGPRALDVPPPAAPAYQRAPMQPTMRPGNPSGMAYPGAYPGSYAGKGAVYEMGTSDNDRKLTIGRGITLSGEIEACDHLLVEGTVEAALKGASVLDIAESGMFYGTVEIDEATVAGRFEGDITVHGRLLVKSTGVITGTIAYKELEVEAGAIIDGRLTPVAGMDKKQQGSASRPKDAPSPKLKAAKDNRPGGPANSDGELFGNKATAAE